MLHRKLPVLLFAATLLVASPVRAEGDHDKARVEVVSNKGSGIIGINITSARRIGKVLIEVKDRTGRTLYREEGKALTEELVRRLDKSLLPKGELTLQVTARDFRIEQVFTVE
ncbi:MAG TPA: hypothetical protein VHL57_10460 [Flavobacteriales bacterium]|jgi:hypothetical protein|nr:hypothetical protein [Flavobacteriales bacterium]